MTSKIENFRLLQQLCRVEEQIISQRGHTRYQIQQYLKIGWARTLFKCRLHFASGRNRHFLQTGAFVKAYHTTVSTAIRAQAEELGQPRPTASAPSDPQLRMYGVTLNLATKKFEISKPFDKKCGRLLTDDNPCCRTGGGRMRVKNKRKRASYVIPVLRCLIYAMIFCRATKL